MRVVDSIPHCPVCQDEMLPVRQERITWEQFATRWHCRRCRREILVPVVHEEDTEESDD
jgi:transposase-like protein